MSEIQQLETLSTRWLPPLPGGWTVPRLRHLCNIATGSGDTVHATPDGDFPFVVRSQGLLRASYFDHDCEAILTVGDGAVGEVFHHLSGKFLAHQRVYVLSRFRDDVDVRYLFHYFSSHFRFMAQDGSAKTTVDSVRRWMLTDMPVALPPKPTQRSIADYLDRETAQIDTLIAEQQRLIELLHERRAAAITDLVTGTSLPGLRHSSSSWWHPTVPSGWITGRVKSFAIMVTDGAHVSPVTEGGTRPFVSTRDVKNGRIDLDQCLLTTPETFELMERSDCVPVPGDVLFSKDGTVGESAVVREGPRFAVASSLTITRLDQTRLLPEFLVYTFSSLVARSQAKAFMRGAGLPRISVANLARVEILVPPLDEQRRIVAELDEVTAKIDTLIAEAERFIELAKERRSALITAAVTGQIDIPGVE